MKPTHVLYYATVMGYDVTLYAGDNIVTSYRAGNHPQESQAFLDPDDPSAVSLETLEGWAREGALGMAENYGVTSVERDPDAPDPNDREPILD